MDLNERINGSNRFSSLH